MTLPPYNPPPPVKEGKGPLFWISLGCSGCLVGIVVFVALTYMIAATAMRQTTPLKVAIATAKADARVAVALGEPVEPGYLVLGNVSMVGDKGTADIRVSISGPKDKGMLHVVAAKKNDKWAYDLMTVKPDHGETIDLLKK